jgi:hypothetical protein
MTLAAGAPGGPAPDVPVPSPSAASAPAIASPMPPCIVIGFVGGFVAHNNVVHSEVQLAASLRKRYSSGVYVEAFENHRGSEAYKRIVGLLDTDRDGKLSEREKRNARIIFYGHSWGGSEAVNLARLLGREGIPVLLTVQVDSVAKHGENDAVIPANVAAAANFYQPDGLVHGRSRIRAADPLHTQIVGNFRFDYKAAPVRCQHYPWWDSLLVKTHTEIECDPKVWGAVEQLIQSKLPPLSAPDLDVTSIVRH